MTLLDIQFDRNIIHTPSYKLMEKYFKITTTKPLFLSLQIEFSNKLIIFGNSLLIYFVNKFVNSLESYQNESQSNEF